MRCPHCQAEPPRDPFVCAHCGERLLTYLGEPLGPGTGLRADEVGMGAGAHRERVGVGDADDDRSWLARQIDPTPPTRPAQPAPGGPAASRMAGPPLRGANIGFADIPAGLPASRTAGPLPAGLPASRPGRSTRSTGSLVGKILFGLVIAVLLLFRWPLGALLLVGGFAILIWRWPRLSFIPFAALTIALAGTLWVVVEIADEMDLTDLTMLPDPTPTVQRPFATPTVVRPAGTPTLAPAQQTATATAVTGESRVLVARGRARWLRGDNQAALSSLDRALTLTPSDAGALNLRALVRISTGNHAGALADSAQAVTMQPSSASYRDTYAYALLKSERYAEAREEYERALTTLRGPDRAGASLGLGLAHLGLANLREAASNIGAGLALLPDTDPDPQLADLEASARRALPGLPPVPSPAASPAASSAATPAASPAASPSPAAAGDGNTVAGRAP